MNLFKNIKDNNQFYLLMKEKKILLGCKYVDDVIENIGNEDSKISILSVNPDIIAIGDDWAKKDYHPK